MKININLERIAKGFIKENPPPKKILNIGIIGSAMEECPLPYSDIDFFGISTSAIDKTTINYFNKLIEHMNQKTNMWTEFNHADLNNNGMFSMDQSYLTSINHKCVDLYGNNLFDNIKTMATNYNGKSLTESLMNKFIGGSSKFRRGLTEINSKQILVSKPPFGMDRIDNATPQVIKGIFCAKYLLTANAFATELFGVLKNNSIFTSYSKRTSPELFQEAFKLGGLEISQKARSIYYDGNELDIPNFLNKDAFIWLKKFQKAYQKLEKIFKPMNTL